MRIIENRKNYFSTAFLAGLLGALAIAIVMAIYRATGRPIVHLELALGYLLTGKTGFGSWLLGFLWHLLNGGIFALIYAAGFLVLRRAGPALGVAFGVVHWCIAGYLLGIFPVWRLPPFFQIAPWTGQGGWYGGLSTLIVFLLHLLFGFIVGSFCGTARFAIDSKRTEALTEGDRDQAA